MIPADNATPVSYDPDAEHPATRLFDHLGEDVEAYLWAALGQGLWRKPDKRFIVLVSKPDDSGLGNEGKTTATLMLSAALGRELTPELSSDALRRRNSKDREGATPENKALIYGAFAIASEIKDWALGWDTLKARTGGDRLAYRPPYGRETITMPVSATIIAAANEVPPLNLQEYAMRSRAIIVHYPKPPSPDPTIKAAFKEAADANADTQAARAALALLIKAASENPPSSEIPIPQAIADAIAETADAELTDFERWLAGAVVKTRRGEDLLVFGMVWEAWAARNGEDPKGKDVSGIDRTHAQRLFKRAFQLRGGRLMYVNFGGKAYRGNGWEGLRLLSPQELTLGDDGGEPAPTPIIPKQNTLDANANIPAGDSNCVQCGEPGATKEINGMLYCADAAACDSRLGL